MGELIFKILALDWKGGFKSNNSELQNNCGTKLDLLLAQSEKDYILWAMILFTTPLSPHLRCNCLSLGTRLCSLPSNLNHDLTKPGVPLQRQYPEDIIIIIIMCFVNVNVL